MTAEDVIGGRSGKLTLAQVFGGEEFIQPVARAFTAVARLLDAAEGRGLAGKSSLVDSDDSGLEPTGHSPDARHVARVEVGGQPVRGVVRVPDHFLLAPETEQRDHG